MTTAAQLPDRLAAIQNDWLAPARSRLLRRAGIAHRQRVLDLGTGTGVTTPELVRRSDGAVLSIDLQLHDAPGGHFAGAQAVRGDALALPCRAGAFDLVYSQFVLLWLDARPAITEIARVLEPGGALVAIEPDYGGMIEYPPEIASRELWLSGLQRAGADPCIGRRLPRLLAQAGFDVRVDLCDRLLPPAAERFELLRGLPLTATELASLETLEAADDALARGAWSRLAHLPCMLISATRA